MASSDENNMLPNTPGPKLGEFKNGEFAKIEFLPVSGMGSGNHAHVWKVKIDGTIYALKMFRNIEAAEENVYDEDKLRELNVDKKLVDDQLTPFNCEARAYGRLRETCNEHLAWKCHGWVALDEETYGQDVWEVVQLSRFAWFHYAFNSDEQVAGRAVFPIYALVKELIPEEKLKAQPIDPAKAHDMAVAINTLHRIGITHRDIQGRNYVDCRFMDFSTSWTVPNVRLDRQLMWDEKSIIDLNEVIDYFMFDNMWDKWNDDHPDKPCDYRMALTETTRLVRRSSSQRSPGQRSASESSEEEELIPTMERFLDNRFIYLPSGYDWQNGVHSGPLEPNIRTSTPAPGPKSISDGSAAPGPPRPHHHNGVGGAGVSGPPSTPVRSLPSYRGPDPKLPRFTMLWSWSAPPPAPRYGGLDAEKLEEIRRYAAEIIRDSRRLKTAVNPLVSRAQNIIKMIDDSNGSSVDEINVVESLADLDGGPSDGGPLDNNPVDVDPSYDFFPDDLINTLADDDVDLDDDHVESERQNKRPRNH